MAQARYSLAAASFEEFVAFMFDHDVPKVVKGAKKEPEPWYWGVDVKFDAARVAGYYIRLFSDPNDALARFSAEQLEQGFWAVQSPNIDCAVSKTIWTARVVLEIRESVIRSMFHLFEKFFAINPLDTSSNMWWDSLAYDWHCGNRTRGTKPENDRIQDVMFETLGRILALPKEECQVAALHGLGHLHHPATRDLIERYLRDNKSIDAQLRDYAHAAARFEVM